MINKLWKFKIDDSDHCIKLKHNNILGIRLIYLDGIKLPESKHIFCFREKTNFNIGKHQCELCIDNSGLQPEYFLSIDNSKVEYEKQQKNKINMPYWSWIFIIVCGLIPIVCVEGVVALCTGIFGIYKCINVFNKIQYSSKKKAYVCAAITSLCWIFIKVYMVAVKYITIYLNGKLY